MVQKEEKRNELIWKLQLQRAHIKDIKIELNTIDARIEEIIEQIRNDEL